MQFNLKTAYISTFFIINIIIILSINLNAVNKIDSLKYLLNETESIEQVDLLLEISEIQHELHPSSSLEYYKKALIISQKIANEKYEYKILLRIGTTYKEVGYYKQALEYYLSALKFAENSHNSQELSFVYNELGIVYASLGKYDESLSYFTKHIKNQEENLNRKKMIIAYNNVANIHFSKKDYEEAINYCKKAISIEIELKDTFSHTFTLNNLGLIYLDMQDYSKSLESYNQSLKLAKAIDDNKAIIHVNSNLVDLYVKTNKPLQALSLLNENVQLAKQIKSNIALRDTYRDYYKLQEKLNNFQEAYNYLKLYNEYTDSILNSESERKIAELKVIYDSQSNEKENEILKKDNLIKSLELSRQEALMYMLIVIGVMIIGFLIVLILRARLNKKHSVLLEKKNADIDKINSEINALNQMLEKRVEERTVQLQDEVKRRTEIEEELRNTLLKAEKANTVKDIFLANMSHEIRTPLNAIIGLSNLVESSQAKLNPELSTHFKGIKKSSETLLNYFNNMLEYSQIKSDEVELNIGVCKIDEVIENALQIHSFTANEKGLELNLKRNILPLVKADCNSITKVVTEVIENSIKYTKTGSIDISTLHIPESNEVYIQVSDTGVGIDQEYLPQIFEYFSQEDDSYSKSFAGIGIGLPLAKRLVDLMNGRIEIASKKGKGTIVKIFLPVHSEEDFIPEQEYISVDDMYIANDILKESGLEILIIEDDEFNALILEQILGKIGNTTTVVDGKSALAAIKNGKSEPKKFDIMIVDINLPGKLDGIELMKMIKEKWSIYDNVPFIAQTAYAMSKDRERLLDSGFDDYISKPIDNDELLMIIKSKLVS